MSNKMPKSFKEKEVTMTKEAYKDHLTSWNPGHSVLLPTHQSLQWLMKSNREIGRKTGHDSLTLINDILTIKKVDRIICDMVQGTLGDWRNYD